VALCASSVFSVSKSGLTRTAAVATLPLLATLLFDTKNTEKAQRATEARDEIRC